MSTQESQFHSLTDDDKELFNSYKESICTKIQEIFPSTPIDGNLEPLSIRRQQGCGTFYTYKVKLPDDQIVEVAFHLGGKRATPLVGPPYFEITKCL